MAFFNNFVCLAREYLGCNRCRWGKSSQKTLIDKNEEFEEIRSSFESTTSCKKKVQWLCWYEDVEESKKGDKATWKFGAEKESKRGRCKMKNSLRFR